MSKIVFAMSMALALAGTTSSFAQVHVIDQTVVRLNGGFPYKITQPGSYKLIGNLTVPRNTDGIVVTANHVTLNLNGFSILGPVVCTANDTTGAAVCPAATAKGIGIRSGDSAGGSIGALDLKIYNGSIHGMGSHGIFITGNGSTVEKVSADGNAGDGMIVEGPVLASSANGNGGFGILAVTIRDSSTVNNAGDGIVVDARGGVAIGNASSFNGGAGITVPNGVANNNTVTRNTGVGISAKCPAVVTGNSIINNDGGSINAELSGVEPCAIANNATLPQF